MSDTMQNNLMLQRAKSAVLSRDFTLAARLYNGLVQNDPDNVDLLTQLADLYVKSGHDDLALSVYKRVSSILPNDVNVLNALGGIYRRLKRYEDSIAVLEQALISDEKNVQVYYNLGFTYKLMGRYEDAIQCFETVVERNPNDVLAFNHLGSIFQTTNNNVKAVNTFLRGLKIDPNHPVLHLNLAKSYEELGKIDNAMKEYEAALKSKPGWIDAIDAYADLLLKKNKTVEAGDLVKQALRLNPNNAKMLTKLGRVYTRQSNFDDAETEFNNALNLEPKNEKILSALADAYEKNGKNDEAVRIMQEVENLKPGDEKMLRQYSHILLSDNKFNSASKKIQTLMEKNPHDVHTLNLLSQLYICRGENAKVDQTFKQIEETDPSYSKHYFEGACRYRQIGQLTKSEKLALKYAENNSRDAAVYYLLAQNYEELGSFQKALENYRKSSEIDGANLSYQRNLDRLSEKLISGEVLPVELKDEEHSEEKIPEADQYDLNADFEDTDKAEIQLGEDDTYFGFKADEENESPLEKSEVPLDENENIFTKDTSDDFNFEVLTEPDTDPEDVLDTKYLDEEIEPDFEDEKSTDLDNLIEEDEDPLEEAEKEIFNKKHSSYGRGDGGEDSSENEDGFEDEFIKDDLNSSNVNTLSDGEEFFDDEDFDDDQKITDEESPVVKNPYGPDFNNYGSEVDQAAKTQHKINPISENKAEAEEVLSPEEEEALANQSIFPEEKSDDNEINPPEEIKLSEDMFDFDDDSKNSEVEDIAPVNDQSDLKNESAPLEEFPAVEEESAPHSPDLEEIADQLNKTPEESDELLEEDLSQIFKNANAPSPDENESEEIQLHSEAVPEVIDLDGEPVPDLVEADELKFDDNFIQKKNEEEFPAEEELPTVESLLSKPAAAESSIMHDAEEKKVEKSEERILLPSLNDVVNKLSDKETLHKFKDMLSLFVKLKELIAYLPDDKKALFLSSKNYVLLDYIIEKLSGKPGLLATADALRKAWNICDEKNIAYKDSFDMQTSLLSYMRTLVKELPDKDIALSLDQEVKHLMENLNY